MNGCYMKYNAGLKWVNPFHTNVLFLYPRKMSKNFWFSDVFRGIKIEHWREKGQCNGNFRMQNIRLRRYCI